MPLFKRNKHTPPQDQEGQNPNDVDGRHWLTGEISDPNVAVRDYALRIKGGISYVMPVETYKISDNPTTIFVKYNVNQNNAVRHFFVKTKDGELRHHLVDSSVGVVVTRTLKGEGESRAIVEITQHFTDVNHSGIDITFESGARIKEVKGSLTCLSPNEEGMDKFVSPDGLHRLEEGDRLDDFTFLHVLLAHEEAQNLSSERDDWSRNVPLFAGRTVVDAEISER